MNYVGSRGRGVGGNGIRPGYVGSWGRGVGGNGLAILQAVFAAVVLLVAAPRANAQIGIDVGAKAPGAAVRTLDGKAADLAQYVGRGPVLIEFWATWCANCRALEPELKRLHAKHGRRVAFVGVAVSANQKPEIVRRYVARHRLPWTQLYDADGEATGAYDVPATSYIVILDRTGRVVYAGLGPDQKLEPVLAALR